MKIDEETYPLAIGSWRLWRKQAAEKGGG